MEVHQHSHSHGKKNWKTYFWEFLMLFLAVFCGFLAEYQLEHKIERDRADEYAGLFLEDLKNDSVYLNKLLVNQQYMLAHDDSLLALLSSEQYIGHNYEVVDHFNKLSVLLDFNPAFPVNFDQAKNSGSLRYIKNKRLISDLSSLNRDMQTIQEVCRDYNDYIKQYLTPFAVGHLNTLQYDIFSRKVLVQNPDIYKWDKVTAQSLANKVNLKKTYDVFFISHFFSGCAEKINLLVSDIRNEYHLK